jgi:phosphatidylinositol alpha-1,6-mannosyltransferase
MSTPAPERRSPEGMAWSGVRSLPRAMVLTPDFPPDQGGIQLVMSRLVSNMDRVEPRVVTFGCPGARSPDRDAPTEVARVARRGGPLHKLAVVRLNGGGIREALRFRPDVIVVGHVLTAPAAAAIRRLRHTPVIQYFHADESRHRPALVRFAVRNADAVVAVSRHAEELAIGLGCDPDKLRVVHPGVDIPDRAHDGAEKRPTVLTVSRMHDSYKGHDVMIRAIRRVRSQVPEVQWVVIGDGPLRSQLEEEAEQEGISSSVRFLGRVSDRERDVWLARAHVFALPSRLPDEGVGGEGFGIVFLEASAHGLPVVAGDEGGALDAVVDGETGCLVDPTNDEALAEAITGLLLDPVRAHQLGRAGTGWARRFSWQRHAAVVEDLMLGLCRDGR